MSRPGTYYGNGPYGRTYGSTFEPPGGTYAVDDPYSGSESFYKAPPVPLYGDTAPYYEAVPGTQDFQDHQDHQLFENKFFRDILALDKSVDQPQNCMTRNLALGCFFCIGFAIAVTLITKYINDPSTFDTEDTEDVDRINYRIQNRGMLASLFSSVILFVITFMIDKIGNVNESTSTALIGMLLGGTVGFMSDIGFATDSGLKTFKGGVAVSTETKAEAETKTNAANDIHWAQGFNYTFGTLTTSMYIRFIIVTLIDTFISLMVFSVAFPKLKNFWPFQCSPEAANGIMSSIISVITFQAYANMTRFLWAYPDKKLDQSQLISTPVIMLTLAVVAATFLNVNTMYGLDSPGSTSITAQGINHPTIKFILILVVFSVMSYVVMYRLDKPEYLDDAEMIDRGYRGKMTFLAIFAIALIFTMATSKRTGLAKVGVIGLACACTLALGLTLHFTAK